MGRCVRLRAAYRRGLSAPASHRRGLVPPRAGVDDGQRRGVCPCGESDPQRVARSARRRRAVVRHHVGGGGSERAGARVGPASDDLPAARHRRVARTGGGVPRVRRTRRRHAVARPFAASGRAAARDRRATRGAADPQACRDRREHRRGERGAAHRRADARVDRRERPRHDPRRDRRGRSPSASVLRLRAGDDAQRGGDHDDRPSRE